MNTNLKAVFSWFVIFGVLALVFAGIMYLLTDKIGIIEKQESKAGFNSWGKNQELDEKLLQKEIEYNRTVKPRLMRYRNMTKRV